MKEKYKKYMPTCVVIFVLFLIYKYWDSAISFVGMVLEAGRGLFIGMGIAFIVNIPMSAIERIINKKGRIKQGIARTISLVTAYLVVICVIAILIQFIVPELVNSISMLVEAIRDKVPELLAKVQNHKYIGPYARDLMSNLPSEKDIMAMVEKVGGFLANGASGAVGMVVSSASTIVSVIARVGIGIFFSIYILAGKEKLARQFTGLINTYLPKGDKMIKLFSLLNTNFRGFFVAQATDAMILGTLCAIGMLILRLPYAVMSGVIMAFTALIPVVGAFIGMATCAFFILTVEPIKALFFLIFILALQQVDNNIIYPRVVGNSVELPGIWVLAAVTLGGGLFGIAGILVSVPIAATCYRLIRDDYYRRNRKIVEEIAAKAAEEG